MKVELILGISSKQLVNWQYNSFVTWADTYAENNLQLQKTLCNQAIYNWFSAEYKKLENEFIEMSKPYLQYSKADLASLYSDVTNKMFFLYPSALDVKPAKNKTTTKYSLN